VLSTNISAYATPLPLCNCALPVLHRRHEAEYLTIEASCGGESQMTQLRFLVSKPLQQSVCSDDALYTLADPDLSLVQYVSALVIAFRPSTARRTVSTSTYGRQQMLRMSQSCLSGSTFKEVAMLPMPMQTTTERKLSRNQMGTSSLSTSTTASAPMAS
jgi:hypothetical protein